MCGLYGVSFSRLIASGKTGILILVPGCCFLLSLFLGTCLLCGRLSWFSAPIALVQCPINRFLRGTTRAIFFHQSSSHPIISRLLTYLLAFCYSATRISISPRSSPRSYRHGGRGVHGCDTADWWRGCPVCLVLQWMATRRRRGGDIIACLISLVRFHPSHEMIGRRENEERRDEMSGMSSLIFRPTPSCPLSSVCLL